MGDASVARQVWAGTLIAALFLVLIKPVVGLVAPGGAVVGHVATGTFLEGNGEGDWTGAAISAVFKA
jgi:hypothetical protein